jgi:hypothetical protein
MLKPVMGRTPMGGITPTGGGYMLTPDTQQMLDQE